MEPTKKYSAFAVKIWKPLTYLLDIYFEGKEKEVYRPYIYDTYRFADDRGEKKVEVRCRPVYQCRIWGIRKVPQEASGLTFTQYSALGNLAKMRIIRRLDESDGWLKCSVDRVDDLGRLIVKLYDAGTEQLINKTLLNETFSPIFGVYREPRTCFARPGADARPKDGEVRASAGVRHQQQILPLNRNGWQRLPCAQTRR